MIANHSRIQPPRALVAELTYRCPLHCPYCSNPVALERYRAELDTATWQRVLTEAAELGVVHVFFSGGEPLVRNDLALLVGEATRLGLYPFLSTSGYRDSASQLTALRDAGLCALQVSLQDANAETNDWLAGLPSFEQKCRCIADAKQLGFHVTLNFVLHAHNIRSIQAIIDRAREWNVDKLELAHVQYSGWAFRNRRALLPTRLQVEEADAAVQAARRTLGDSLEIAYVLPDYFAEYPKACLHGWAREFLTVAPDGVVLPCQTARIPGLDFPNVRDTSLRTIWYESSVFQKFRGYDWMPEPCQSCPRKEIDFAGCRCQAFLLTGDAAATDPACHLSPHHSIIERLHQEVSDREPLVFRTLKSQ